MTRFLYNEEFYELESDIKSFLEEKYKQAYQNSGAASMWSWSMNTPLLDNRFSNLIEKSPEMMHIALTDINYDKRSVLDLGCGFCQYWPFLQTYGFSEFAGIDLYSLRGQGTQEYMKTAQELADEFCKESNTEIYEGDIRDINRLIDKDRKFDLIFTKNTDYTKLGSTGIPKSLFDDIVDARLTAGGIAIYAG